jgi:hypothetical protein
LTKIGFSEIIIISLSLNMGPYLTVPRKEKDSVDGENNKVSEDNG